MIDLKTLKVCLSKDLPSLQDRDSNTIYFLRDKLIIYHGKSMYHDPYAIVEDIPSEPITGLLYFLLSDGTVRTYMEYQVVTIAQIEDEEQLELLKQTGSVFFVNSQRRYLDLERRIVTLPYNNGTYELTVDMADSLKINEKTVIGFNPSTNMFEMVGDSYNELIFDYRAKNSNSINTVISDKRISSEVKISESYGNIIRVASDGLYASVKDVVSKTQFDSWATYYQEYKSSLEGYLKSLIEKIDEANIKVSSSTINEKIIAALKEEYSNIEFALSKFDEYVEQIHGIEKRVKEYSDRKYEEIYRLLSDRIQEIMENIWGEFNEPEEPENGDVEEPLPDNPETGDGESEDPVDKDESTSGESNSDYNTGVEDQGTTDETENGDDTTPIEDNTSENLTEDNTSIQEESEELEEVIADNSEKESPEVTETDTSTGDDETELTESEENIDTSTDIENSEQNPIDP